MHGCSSPPKQFFILALFEACLPAFMLPLQATGYGVVEFAKCALEDKGDTLKGKRCLITGSGKVSAAVVRWGSVARRSYSRLHIFPGTYAWQFPLLGKASCLAVSKLSACHTCGLCCRWLYT